MVLLLDAQLPTRDLQVVGFESIPECKFSSLVVELTIRANWIILSATRQWGRARWSTLWMYLRAWSVSVIRQGPAADLTRKRPNHSKCS
jgi:hypothetical protein